MPLTDEEYELLNYFEQVWMEAGLLITRDKAAIDYGIPVDFFDKCWKNREFRKALEERGISLKTTGALEKWRLKALTEQQLTAANVMLDFADTRSQKKKLADLGVTTAQWQSWLRDKAFQDYLRQRAENVLGDNTHEAHLALIDKVRSGDMNAIKYYNEITGRFVSSADSNVNPTLIILRVLELIQKYVTDTKIQELLAEEFLALAKPGDTIQLPGAVGSSVSSSEKVVVATVETYEEL